MAPALLIRLTCLASLASSARGIKTLGLARPGKPLFANPADPDLQVDPLVKTKLAWMKANPHSVPVINGSINLLGVQPQWWVEESGGYELLFDTLHHFYEQELAAATEAQKEDFVDVQMNAWIGISDQAHTRKGAAAICNYGGPSQGLQFMFDQLKLHQSPRAALRYGNHLSFQYEIMQCINGCIQWDADVNNAYSQLLAEGGYVNHVLQVMRSESDLRATQSTGCLAIQGVLLDAPSALHSVDYLGAKETLETAREAFSWHDPTPFHMNASIGECYPVKPECKLALWRLDNATSAV